ncbi:ankyrin repeat domain-containing protein 12, partial [Patella vulgata]|uniref:ankyrin repeat domain-containing protein 12 n=1 Tax=Patella vulgata TaxID=6465 RepID=UPI00218010E3
HTTQIKQSNLFSDSSYIEKRGTPKRKRGSITAESSPDPGNNINPRTPQPSRITVPLSERQQLAMLMKMTDESTQGDSSPKPSSPNTPVSGSKRTPIDKKVNKRNDCGETALHGAAKRGDVKETKRLIKAGADVNVTDYAGWTPLHEACIHGMLQVAKQLLKAGANVKVEGLDNDTPLHDAAVNGHHKLVMLLLKHGANPHQANSEGKTAIDVAKSPDLERLLKREIIMSNSDSSSVDDVRSPMSPESNSSLKDEDRQLEIEHSEDFPMRGFGKDGTGGSGSRRVLIPKSPDKTGSPRLLIKFKPKTLPDRDITQKSKDTKEPQFKSYSVTVDTGEHKDSFSGTGSPVSSVDSDLYDPGLDNPQLIRKEEDSNKQFSSNSVYETFSDKNTSSSVAERPFSELGKESSSLQNYDELSEGDEERSHATSGLNRGLWDYSHIPQTERNHCVTLRSSSVAMSGVIQTSEASSAPNSHHVTVTQNSDWASLNPVKKSAIGVTSGNNVADTSDSADNKRWDSPQMPQFEDSVQFSEDNSQSSLTRPEDDGDEVESRPSSPKVPPLKIIIPPKTADKEKVSLKVTLKPGAGALPYVYNPSQGEQSSSEQPSSAPAELLRTASPATSRPMTSSSAPPVSNVEDYDKSDKEDTVSEKGSDTKTETAESAAKAKEDTANTEKEERRVTRQLRSHTAQLQQQKEQQSQPTSSSSAKNSDKNNSETAADTGSYQKPEENEDSSSHIHPRKRKLRPKPEPEEKPAATTEVVTIPNPASWYQMPPNPYELFLSIRRQISSRRKNLSPVTPKPPNGYKDYLMVNCTYVLQGNTASTLSVPMLSCPHSVEGPMRDLFKEQENARYKLRLQHLIEREKLVLSAEQEMLREHGRAARADMNQSIPLSACTVLREEEIYNFLQFDQPEDCEKNVRARYNKRQFLSWLQDVSDKYEKIKKFLLYRHRHEAESLNAVQKLDWECKLKELGLCDHNVTPSIDELHLPMVTVSDEFELLPL